MASWLLGKHATFLVLFSWIQETLIPIPRTTFAFRICTDPWECIISPLLSNCSIIFRNLLNEWMHFDDKTALFMPCSGPHVIIRDNKMKYCKDHVPSHFCPQKPSEELGWKETFYANRF